MCIRDSAGSDELMISTGAKRVTSDTGVRSRSQSYGKSLPTTELTTPDTE